MDDDYDWEEVITCEGMLRKVTVEFEASELEKDWGQETTTGDYWPDELKGA